MAQTQANGYSAVAGDEAAGLGDLPVLLGALAIATMGSQIRFPALGGRVSPADMALAVALVAVLWDLFRRRTSLRYPLLLGVALGLYVLSGLVARAGRAGALESVQRFEQLFCAFLVFLVFFHRRRRWFVPLFSALLALNVLVAALQVLRHGYGSVLPPADVAALPWGFGGAYSGLFRSRVALGLFLGSGLVLVQPSWLAWAERSRVRLVLVVVGTGLVLSMIAYGPLLVLAGVVLLTAGLFAGRRAAAANAVALFVAVLFLAVWGPSTLSQSLSLFRPGEGEVKTCYADTVAAMRMAARRPWTGVGAGTYQMYIGRCYGELPNPNYNDIETDTQSGVGILFGTVGYPAGLAMLVAILACAVGAFRRYCRVPAGDPLHLGAGSALAVYLPAMLVTDPFVRGPAWCLTMALALAFDGDEQSPSPALKLDLRRVVGAGVIYAAAAGLLFVLPTKDALAHVPGAVSRPRPERKLAAVTAPDTGAESGSAAAVNGVPAGNGAMDFFRVIDAGDAVEVAAPMEKGTDSQAARGVILRIPDKKGVPPEGEEPDMKYGGAAFDVEVAAPLTCKIWLRVWWEGSCGNTVALRVGQEEKAVTVGNDGTYDVWHWMESPKTYPFAPGTHRVYVLNREDGIRVDQILITNDMEYYPQGIEEE
ncbi:MAG: hypothetical protein JXR77_15190 [Lentisphaeria bacterium]|nr:hypothetical protein [Lentisphaeria bacterium]